MKLLPFLTLLFALAVSPACASSMPAERKAYVLSRPFAWVEITVADEQIPRVPIGEGESRRWVRPDRCRLSVSVDGEPSLSADVYPQGEEEPYHASSGFRFPVPTDASSLRVWYAGCRLQDDAESTAEFVEPLRLQPSLAYEFLLRGSDLEALPSRPDTSVDLEDIYELLTSQESSP